jgi:hypothetical protein
MPERARLALVLWLACGCAHIDIERETKADQKGARFYPPQPYLFQALTEKGCNTSIVYLPDLAEPWRFRVRPGLGSVKGSASLTDGWNLASFGYDADSRIPETINALTGAAKLAVPGAREGPPLPCPPVLEKLHWTDGGWRLP